MYFFLTIVYTVDSYIAAVQFMLYMLSLEDEIN